MRKILCHKFLPVNYRQEAFLEYHNLSQWSSTIEDFIAAFNRLRMRCGAEEQEEQVIARFLGSLRTKISEIVQLQPYWTFTYVCNLALKVERQSKNKNKVIPSKFNINKAETFGSTANISHGSRFNPTKEEASCGPITQVNPSSRLSHHFKCQGIGHYLRDCPNQ